MALTRRTNELADAVAVCRAAKPPPDAPGLAVVWVEHDASVAEVEAIRQVILASEGMASLDYVDRAETEADAASRYSGRPEVLEATPLNQFPTHFVVDYDTVADADEAAATLAPLPRIQEVAVTTPGFCLAPITELVQWCRDAGLPDQLLVWLQPEATDNERAAVADALLAEPGVVGFVYWDPEATWAEFEQYYDQRNEVVDDSITASDLPTSFRVDLESGLRRDLGRLTELRRSLEGLPGVRATDIANRELGDHCLTAGRIAAQRAA